MTGTIIKHRGKTWRTLFLHTDSLLKYDDRERLVYSVLDMYADRKKDMKVKGEGYEGLIKADGYHLVGQFGGRQFDARLDTEHGKSRLCFLVCELVDSSLN